jgi:hypothetical protein
MLFLNKVIKKPKFTSDIQNLIPQNGKRSKLYKKSFMIFVFIISILTGISIFLINPFFLEFTRIYAPQMALNIVFVVLVMFSSIVGLLTIQRKDNKTDVFFFWVMYFIITTVESIILDALFIHHYWWFRIVIIGSSIVSISACTYVYYHLENNALMKRNGRKVLTVFFLCLVLNFGIYQSANYWYKTDSDINVATDISLYIPRDDGMMVTGFRWAYILDYYTNNGIITRWGRAELIKIENHFDEAGNNNLLRLTSLNNIYVLLDHLQTTLGILGLENEFHGILNETDLESYYHLSYLNKIMNMKSQGYPFTQIYWVNQ